MANATEMTTVYDLHDHYFDNYEDNYGDKLGDSPDRSRYMLAIFYSLVFAFSLCANILVLVIIYLFEKLTTVTNLLLLNLVLSSLLFISSVPFVAVRAFLLDWPFGRIMCKLVGSLYYLGFFSSVLFLALMTFDRHLAVVYSVSAARMRTKTYAWISCAVVWMVSALACIKPMLGMQLRNQTEQNVNLCQEDPELNNPALRYLGIYTQLLLFFLFPLLLIVYCYSRIACTVFSSQINTKLKTVRLIFVIVLLFFACWTPFNIAMMRYEMSTDTEVRNYWRNVLATTQTFAHFYFCISPIFYTFVGKKFQNYFLMLLVKRFPRLRRHISISHSGGNIHPSIPPFSSNYPGLGRGSSSYSREPRTSLTTHNSISSSGRSQASLHVDQKFP